MSNSKWTVTIRLYSKNEKLVGSFDRVVWAATEYAAQVAAQTEGTRLCKVHKADYWLVSVN